MRDKLDFLLGEILRLENTFPDSWEVIFRYFVKINTLLSSITETKDKEVLEFIDEYQMKVTNKELKTIGNIYFSKIFYNRAEVLEYPLRLGNQDFKPIPDFVDKSKIKEHLFSLDPSFESKNIYIRGGWLDRKKF